MASTLSRSWEASGGRNSKQLADASGRFGDPPPDLAKRAQENLRDFVVGITERYDESLTKELMSDSERASAERRSKSYWEEGRHLAKEIGSQLPVPEIPDEWHKDYEWRMWLKGNPTKGCKWVDRKPDDRCGKKSHDLVRAYDACPSACAAYVSASSAVHDAAHLTPWAAEAADVLKGAGLV